MKIPSLKSLLAEVEFGKGWQKSAFTPEEKEDFLAIIDFIDRQRDASGKPTQTLLTQQELDRISGLSHLSKHSSVDVLTPSHFRLASLDPDKMIALMDTASRLPYIPNDLKQSAKKLHLKLSQHFA